MKRHANLIPLALQSTTAPTTSDRATAADLVTSAVQLSHIEEMEEEAGEADDELLADINLAMARVTRRTLGELQELEFAYWELYVNTIFTRTTRIVRARIEHFIG